MIPKIHIKKNYNLAQVYTHLLPIIQSNTNLGTAIKGFCRCNEAIKSVDFKYGDYPGECGGAKLITCVL